MSRQAPAGDLERPSPAAVDRRDEAARQVPVDREGEARRSPGVHLGPAVRSDRTAAAQEDPTRADPPEEDWAPQPRLSRRAAVVRVKTLNLVIWSFGHLVID